MLTCRQGEFVAYVLLLDPGAETTRLVSVDPPHHGKLAVTDNSYAISFERRKDRWAGRMRVNRFTGEYEFEWGKPPFGESNPDNIFGMGFCTKGPVKQIL